MENKTSAEKYWINLVRVFGILIGFLPFIPNALFYLGFKDEELPVSSSMIFFVLVGFIFVWGSAHFGTWANSLGKTVVSKFKK
jgi:hypothetical protein